jgi:hypothetical protein
LPPADLPESGKPGAHRKTAREGGAEALPFLPRDDAGADEAHLTAHHIPELRQLIETGSAEETAEGGHAGVVLQLHVHRVRGCQLGVFAQNAVGVLDHGAQLQGVEVATVAAQDPSPEEHGPGRGGPNPDRQRDQQGGAQQEEDRGEDRIQQNLDSVCGGHVNRLPIG